MAALEFPVGLGLVAHAAPDGVVRALGETAFGELGDGGHPGQDLVDAFGFGFGWIAHCLCLSNEGT